MRNLLLLFGIMACWLTSPAQHNDAGVESIEDFSGICPGSHPIQAVIKNYGENQISSLTVNWSVDGITQTPVSYTSVLDMAGGSGSSVDTVDLTGYAFSAYPQGHAVKVWTSAPNGNTDTTNYNDTLNTSLVLQALSEVPLDINFPFSGLTTTTADIDFNTPYSATYSIIYDTTGFDPATGGTGITGVTPSHTISGLQAGAYYDVYVYAECTGASTTDTVAPVTFHTLCLTQSLPYTENFDNGPGCFQIVDGEAAPLTFVQGMESFWDVDGTPYVSITTLGFGNGIEFYEMVVSPSMDASGITPGSSLGLEFDHIWNNTSSLVSGHVEVYYQSQWHRVRSYYENRYRTSVHEIIDITAYASADLQFRMVFESDSSDRSTTWIIDNISVTEQSCLEPQTASLTALGANLVTVQLNTGISAFDYEVDTTGFAVGTGRISGGSNVNPGVINGLQPNTAYDLYVRNNCDDSDTSAWVGPFSFRTSCTGAMSGTYTVDKTIPPSATNFTSIFELEENLNYCGVSGPVTVNVAEGTYHEQLYLHNIPGAGSSNPIIIQTDPANTVRATLNYAASSDTDNYVVRLDTISYFTIRKMNMIASDTMYGNVIDLSGGYNDHIVIEEDSISTKPFAGGWEKIDRWIVIGEDSFPVISERRAPFYAIYSNREHGTDQGPNDHVTIKKNIIRGGYVSVFFSDLLVNGVDWSSDLLIDSNEVHDWFHSGIHLLFMDSATVSNNTISTDSEARHAIALIASQHSNVLQNYIDITGGLNRDRVRIPWGLLYYSNVYATEFNSAIYAKRNIASNVVGNEVYIESNGTGKMTGIYFSSIRRDNSSRSLLANNMVVVGNSGEFPSMGIECGGVMTDILHNSVNILGSDAGTAGMALFQDVSVDDTEFKVFNNNIVNSAGGVSLSTDLSIQPTDSFDRNNYYTTGSFPFTLTGSISFSNLQDWRNHWNTALGFDLKLEEHSVNVDPLFVSNTDLHSSSPVLDGRAKAFPSVPDDIDGEDRSVHNPDIGVDEFSIVEGNCDFFTNYRIDSIVDTKLKLNWDPGSSSSEYYIEYGLKGYSQGDNPAGSVSGSYPADNPPILISGLTPDTEYDFYVTEYCNSGNDSSYFALPWGPVKTTISCFPIEEDPEMIFLSHDSVAFSLDAEGPYDSKYIIEYGPSGFDQGTGTLVTAGDISGIGGLAPATYYDVYFKSDCSDSSRGQATGFYGPVQFRTECAGGLSGTYTLGSAPGPRNFRGFGQLADQLNFCGVDGPVVVNVAPGNYRERFYVHNIPGSGATNSILIQSDPANTSTPLVKVTTTPDDQDRNYIIKMDTVSHITVRGLSISAEGEYYGRVIDLSGGYNDHLTFEDNIIQTLPFATSANFAGIYNRRGINTNVTISNNIISGGFYGIYFPGTYNYPAQGSLVIDSNTVTKWRENGIYTDYRDTVRIVGNTITNTGSIPGMSGGSAMVLSQTNHSEVSDNIIEISRFSTEDYVVVHANKSKVTGNKIHIEFPEEPNQWYQSNSALSIEGDSSTISNNMVSIHNIVDAAGGFCGIYLGGNNMNFVHNSVSISGNPDDNSVPLQVYNINLHTVYNNNLVNKTGGFAMDLGGFYADEEKEIKVDYNNYYTNGPEAAKYPGHVFNDLSQWQDSLNIDLNSVNGDPYYVSVSDLHAQGSITNNAGKVIIAVADDIDGEQRSLTAPDIGADEYNALTCLPPSRDITVLNTYSDSAEIAWVAGSGTTTLEYGPEGFAKGSGTLVTGLTDTNYTITGLAPRKAYDVYVRNICAPGDSGARVGPVPFYTECEAPLSGIYTVDPSGSENDTNYVTLGKAVEDLNYCGISGPVEFKVANGTYNEQISFEGISGSSPVNTVTFSGDTSSTGEIPVLRFAGNVGNDYVVRFQNTSHVTIEGLKIVANGDYYGHVVDFTGGNNKSITFRNDTISTKGARSLPNHGYGFGNFVCIYSDSPEEANDHILIEDNTLSGLHGVYLNGSTSNAAKGLAIEGNDIVDWYGRGVYLSEWDSVRIMNNTMKSPGNGAITYPLGISSSDYLEIAGNHISVEGSETVYGMHIDLCNGIDIRNNRIQLMSDNGGSGIYYEGDPSVVLSDRSTVANNMISLNSRLLGDAYGMEVYGSNVDYFYNSINIYGSNNTSYAGIYLGKPSADFNGNKLFNNNIVNQSGGYAIYEEDTGSIDSADYNNYHTTGDNIVYSTMNYATLTDWQTAGSFDMNSMSADPLYTSDDDLHLGYLSPVMEGGKPLSGIDTDIDGDERSSIMPDIGADEYQPASGDLYLSGMITSPADSSCGDSNTVVSIVVVNLTTEDIYNFDVEATIQGPAPARVLHYNYTDTLSGLESDTVHLSSFNSFEGGNYTIRGTINYSKDSNLVNNTLLDSIYLYSQEGIQPMVVSGYFCNPGVYDTLYIENDEREVHWLDANNAVLGTGDSLVVGPLGSSDTTFYVEVSDNKCNIPAQAITLDHLDNITADFNYTMRQPTIDELEVDFDASGLRGGSFYNWDFGDGNTGSGETTGHTYTANGSYDVELIVSGDCGTDTIVKTILIEGIDIEESILSRSLEVYPNPTTDEVHVTFETGSSEGVSVSIFDLSGKVIYTDESHDINGRYEGEIYMGLLARGVYMLKIESGDVRVVRRIVKN